NLAVPYPGTELYENLRAQGLLQDVDWRNMYQDSSLVGTEELTPENLNRLRKIAYTKLYFNPRWWWQNARFALANRDDFELATRYAMRILNNYFVHGMHNTH
ncbi:MAG: hypothetical protein V3W28_04055, partial [Thermoplasmata archaeon]